MPVTLSAKTVNGLGYSSVVVEIDTTSKPDLSSVKFYAVDSNQQPIEQTNTGTWGPQSGFALTNDYNKTSDFTVTFSKEGTYTVVVKLKDLKSGKYIADETVNVTVVQQ